MEIRADQKINALLFLIILMFFLFGSFSIGKFETSDETFWKHTRISRYWKALSSGNLNKTYINDKPGVTVALFSGIGMFFESKPGSHKIETPAKTNDNFFIKYDVSRTEAVNKSLRYPILILSCFFLFFFFWIIKKMTGNAWLALLAVFFMATSPIIIGISRIINPDAFLWSFSTAALFSFLALLKTEEKKFIYLSGIFTGFALLSKYTANILFPVYLMLIFLNYFFSFETIIKNIGSRKYFTQKILHFFLIGILSAAVFSIFLPAVFVNPKYLYEGTIGFPGLKMLLAPTALIFALLFIDLYWLKSKLTEKIGTFIFRYRLISLKIIAGLMLFIFIFSIIDSSWGNQKILQYEYIKDAIYAKGKGGFDKILKEFPLWKKFLIEFQPFIFSLHIAVLGAILFYWTKIIFSKKTPAFFLPVFFLTVFPLIYFSGALFSEVLSNIRYSIMLYPLFALLSAFSVFDILNSLKNYKIKIVIIFSVTTLLLASLWLTKPHYFTYTNDLMPKKFTITDAWGYGNYEAAQYLNSLPNAENLTIWSNRHGICQFFIGNCIRSTNINLSKGKPDYFVISRRGELKSWFKWKNSSLAKHAPDYYYSKLKNPEDWEWSIFIGDRPNDYVKIIKSEENL